MSKVITCLHCGNRTKMEVVARHDDRVTFEGEWEEVSYILFQCPICEKVTLEMNTLYSEDILDYQGDYGIENATRTTCLYPQNSITGYYVPERVQKAFDAAIRVRNIDAAICVLALRRALEIMCKEKNANGKTLFHKLQDLEKKKVLPHIMKDLAIFLKDEGNSAAHGDNIEFDSKRVDLLVDFTKNILDYVYTLPGQLEEAQTQIGTWEEQQDASS